MYLFAAENAQEPSTGGFGMLIMFGLIFAIFYFFIIMPAKKKQKAHKELVSSLKEGERVVTAGGIYGTVTRVFDDRFEIQVDKNSKLQVAKASVSSIVNLDKTPKK